MKRFADRIVLITGGSTGIGQATAQAFAREGATVMIAGRRAQAGAETVSLLKEQGAEASFVQADVAVEADVARLVEEVVARYGRLDIAFNNAGSFGVGPLIELTESAWDAIIATNLKGAWLSMKYEIRQMRSQGSGTIVNVSSTFGPYMATPMIAPYAAAKAGIIALTQVAALEYIRSGIRINAVTPGPVRTSMSKRPGETDEQRDQRYASVLPIGRIGLPAEVANAVLWLSLPESSYVVGQDIVLDGGSSIQ